MTEPPHIPVVPGADPTLAQLMPSPAPQPSRRPGWVIPVVAVLVVLLLGAGGSATYLLTRQQPTAAPTTPPSKAQGPTVVDAQPPPPRTYYTPKPADFKLSAKVTEKKCFGSAGCLITFNLEIEYTGQLMEPASEWAVTYEVVGVTEPYINTFTLEATDTGFTYSIDREERVETPKSSTVLAPKVTAVSRR